eukprot:827830-Amorphochlora_amoeboformis.AAC.2
MDLLESHTFSAMLPSRPTPGPARTNEELLKLQKKFFADGKPASARLQTRPTSYSFKSERKHDVVELDGLPVHPPMPEISVRSPGRAEEVSKLPGKDDPMARLDAAERARAPHA